MKLSIKKDGTNARILRLAIPSIASSITVPLVGMTDVAIAGRLGDAAFIGGIAIGAMLFDMLYWNLGFLRVGTAGLTAQAYGRRDFKGAMKALVQSMVTALLAATIVLLIQFPYVWGIFKFVKCSAEVEHFARMYFSVRVFAAPATLSLFALRGWFIGMQNTVSPMIIEFVVNGINIIVSIYLVFYAGMGVHGIALGTVIAQYAGLTCGLILWTAYYRKLRKYIDWAACMRAKDIGRFFALNSNLFFRTLCMLFIYCGFEILAARYGDLLLAVSTIMMKLMLLYSYVVDGFAYAGEALAGRFIGAKDPVSLRRTTRSLMIWAVGIGIVSTFLYLLCGESLLGIMTSNPEVIEAAAVFLPWLLVMPTFSCIAFMWDGIFIGATAVKSLRNVMILAVLGFIAGYYATESLVGIHALWVGYTLHLLIRSVYMTAVARKKVFVRAEQRYNG
ncbi:MAG: MATE family efflux transporter [Bacteroidales bacterium]|nr:MATE family efflux transporter [Bacteroidales bacterium]MCL2739254.1 MATE family efflux transporter [Bacteroidales bacterium]